MLFVCLFLPVFHSCISILNIIIDNVKYIIYLIVMYLFLLLKLC
jgi:hypothetical protein